MQGIVDRFAGQGVMDFAAPVITLKIKNKFLRDIAYNTLRLLIEIEESIQASK
jgi:hypothetical protein